MKLAPLLAIALALAPATAVAGPWTRDQGHFYLNLSYARVAFSQYYGANREIVDLGGTDYVQNNLNLYGEVGILTRWLTASVEATLLRYNNLQNLEGSEPFRARTYGLGDFRVGLWTGLVTKPLRLAAAFLVGFPTGDPRPKPGLAPTDPNYSNALFTTCSLPTGDGEFDFELRGSLGYAFGGKPRWPLQHYVIAEPGVWLRTRSRGDFGSDPCVLSPPEQFPHGFTYRAEFGVKFPWPFLDRFWFVGRLAGVELLVADENLRQSCGTATVGLGACVAYTAPGFSVSARIVRGFGAAIGLDWAVTGRYVPVGSPASPKGPGTPNLQVIVAYEH